MIPKPIAFRAALLLVLAACGGGGGDEVTDPLSDNDLSEAEIVAVAAAVQGAANQGTASGAPTPSLAAKEWSAEAARSGNIVLNGQYPCQVAGRVSWTGNVPWTADTTTGAWTIGGGVVFQFGDRTNNLNDCQVAPDVILDGTLNFILSGNDVEGVGSSLNGYINFNRRGPSGGLVPRGSCWVYVTVMRGATRATGTVCGHPVT
jgi:hypothetical protein